MQLGLRQTISQKQTQSLVITPKLRQAIEVLLMSRLDLTQHLRLQLEENPMLEELLEGELEEPSTEDEITSEETTVDENAVEPDPEIDPPSEDEIQPDFDWQDFLDDSFSPSERLTFEHGENDEGPAEDVAQQESLLDHLQAQLDVLSISPQEREVGEYLIGNLDQDGMLTVTLIEVSEVIGCSIEDVEAMLTFIQRRFEPIGIAFRDTRETLLIQLSRNQAATNPLAEKILTDFYEDLKHYRIRQLAQNLDLKTDQVLEAVDAIATLDPYPGRRFTQASNQENRYRAITPDVMIEEVDGEYLITTNDSGMPKLRLNSTYLDMIQYREDSLDPKAKLWLEEYRSKAIDILNSVYERQQTIQKIAEAIFEVQRGFLEKGVSGLKPLVQRRIAEMVGVHESTVSRATSGKYAQTPQGLYKLEYFFSSSLTTEMGEISATSVQDKIQ
ncbi:MAG: RNA polymerase factor sigma-54, partial [Candidatus Poribacteria bacterium]|nr:RNA polymerase factor sigma-54 [Candidatus Poribacteria bacterium]